MILEGPHSWKMHSLACGLPPCFNANMVGIRSFYQHLKEQTYLFLLFHRTKISITNRLKTNANTANRENHKRQFHKQMSKIRTTDISPARSSRSLGKFLVKTEQQTWNCEVYLFRMPQAWWDNWEESHQNYIHVDVPWKNRYFEGFEGASK